MLGITEEGVERVVPLLQSLKVRSLDYTLATHFHTGLGQLVLVRRLFGAWRSNFSIAS